MILAPIVEGFGEVDAIPVLIRRIAKEAAPNAFLKVLLPHRVKRQKIVQPGELERVIDLAGRRIGSDDAIVVLLDADDDCPATLGPELLRRALQARPDRKIRVVLAKREFEAWIIAGVESLRGIRTIAADAAAPLDAEAISGAKEWLGAQMASGYSATIDQAALAARVDLLQARRAPSFDKFFRDIAGCLESFGHDT